MAENPNQPRESDAVLESQATPLVGGVVLGGLERVEQRWKRVRLKSREFAIATLNIKSDCFVIA